VHNNYSAWLEKFGEHISSNTSENLSKLLIAPNFSQKIWEMPNRQQYKQIKIVKSKKLVILTSLFGRSIKIFSLDEVEENGSGLIQRPSIPVFSKFFNQQVVEVCFDPTESYAFFSLTDFGKEGLKDKVLCLNLKTFETVFEIETKGSWSKYIAFHPYNLLLVSNWQSNDISIIDIKNIYKPKLVQVIPCGISPRGIGVTPGGKICIVACFYSRNLVFLRYLKSKRKFKIDKIMDPFDYPNYSGNMRHVVTDKIGKYAYVSNMGRSLIHKVEIKGKKIIESYPCGTFPNTIALSEDQKFLAVSCRQSNIACVLDLSDGSIRTIIDTGPAPTGLDFMKEKTNLYNLYVTNFDDDSVSCTKLYLD